jgi:hypothetical protein
MNRRNNWENILKIANEDLDKHGYSILVVEPEEGFYNCEIWKDGEMVELYAENYYENELNDLVTEVWHYINNILEEE